MQYWSKELLGIDLIEEKPQNEKNKIAEAEKTAKPLSEQVLEESQLNMSKQSMS